MKERNEKMTDEMKAFKNKCYQGFIYINIIWIVICSVSQIFGSSLRIKIMPDSFVSINYNNLNKVKGVF